MHHYGYWVKLGILLALVLCLHRILRVSVSLHLSRWMRKATWLSAALEVFETEGWILIPATVLAALWQIVERP